MVKMLLLGFVIYFVYKFMFRPSLKEGKSPQDNRQEGEIEIRNKSSNPRENGGEYIDYEEVE